MPQYPLRTDVQMILIRKAPHTGWCHVADQQEKSQKCEARAPEVHPFPAPAAPRPRLVMHDVHPEWSRFICVYRLGLADLLERVEVPDTLTHGLTQCRRVLSNSHLRAYKPLLFWTSSTIDDSPSAAAFMLLVEGDLLQLKVRTCWALAPCPLDRCAFAFHGIYCLGKCEVPGALHPCAVCVMARPCTLSSPCLCNQSAGYQPCILAAVSLPLAASKLACPGMLSCAWCPLPFPVRAWFMPFAPTLCPAPPLRHVRTALLCMLSLVHDTLYAFLC